MKITRAQLRRLFKEEIEVLSYKIPKGKTDIIIDGDDPGAVKAKEDSWAGGQNIHSQEEHQLKMGTKEKVVRGIERLKNRGGPSKNYERLLTRLYQKLHMPSTMRKLMSERQ